MSRSDTLDLVVQRIGRLRLGHPVRVAVDGRTASGKTTLATSLPPCSPNRGVASSEHPLMVFIARGWSATHEAVIRLRATTTTHATSLLSSSFCSHRLDLMETDATARHLSTSTPINRSRRRRKPPTRCHPDRGRHFPPAPELRDHWDVALFVRTSAETAQARGLGRDAGKLGGEAVALDLYTKRYRQVCAV